MPPSSVKVARGLLLYGDETEAGLGSGRLLGHVKVATTTFRDGAPALGTHLQSPGLRFFDTQDRSIRFGPGAGLVMSVSVGSGSMHAALVDANARLHFPNRLKPVAGQLALAPTELLDRIKHVVEKVFVAAFKDKDRSLLVDNALPFLGISVAWAVPVDRDERPLGAALHAKWLDGASLSENVGQHLNIRLDRSHAINDAHASAIGVAWHQTRHKDHATQTHSRMAIVMRLAGGIGGASIIVERPEPEGRLGPTSGFIESVLIGGRDYHAGELGHLSVDKVVIDELNANRPAGLGPLEPFRCSCVAPARAVPDHLEAYSCTSALAHRIAPGKAECDVVDRVIKNPRVPAHARALDDLGVLVGHALRGPVLMLNPATITLTGMLAVSPVTKAVNRYLLDNKPFGSQAEVRDLGGDDNRLLRVRGAGLAILRAKVHRHLTDLLGGRAEEAQRKVRDLTEPLTRVPWES